MQRKARCLALCVVRLATKSGAAGWLWHRRLFSEKKQQFFSFYRHVFLTVWLVELALFKGSCHQTDHQINRFLKTCIACHRTIKNYLFPHLKIKTRRLKGNLIISRVLSQRPHFWGKIYKIKLQHIFKKMQFCNIFTPKTLWFIFKSIFEILIIFKN